MFVFTCSIEYYQCLEIDFSKFMLWFLRLHHIYITHYGLLDLIKTSCNIKPWIWNLATVPAWSDLIYVTLWRNDGFSHSFYNFSKVMHLAKILLEQSLFAIKFSFEWVYFQTKKPRCMFFNLCWKNCEKPFTRGHDHFEGKGSSGDKNQYKLFCKKWDFKDFYKTIFSKKKISKINAKSNFWGIRPFFREWGIRIEKLIQPFP